MDALLPGQRAVLVGLEARADLNGCHCVVLEASSDGRFPTRVERARRSELSGEEPVEPAEPGAESVEEELVRVRARNLRPR